MTAAAPAPLELQLSEAGRLLTVDFGAAGRFALPAEFLRVSSPSAEVQGHGPGQRTLVAGRQDVAITRVEPVGNYAVRLRFDDGHDTGLYTWETLYRLGAGQEALWREYLADLAAKGLRRTG